MSSTSCSMQHKIYKQVCIHRLCIKKRWEKSHQSTGWLEDIRFTERSRSAGTLWAHWRHRDRWTAMVSNLWALPALQGQLRCLCCPNWSLTLSQGRVGRSLPLCCFYCKQRLQTTNYRYYYRCYHAWVIWFVTSMISEWYCRFLCKLNAPLPFSYCEKLTVLTIPLGKKKHPPMARWEDDSLLPHVWD